MYLIYVWIKINLSFLYYPDNNIDISFFIDRCRLMIFVKTSIKLDMGPFLVQLATIKNAARLTKTFRWRVCIEEQRKLPIQLFRNNFKAPIMLDSSRWPYHFRRYQSSRISGNRGTTGSCWCPGRSRLWSIVTGQLGRWLCTVTLR